MIERRRRYSWVGSTKTCRPTRVSPRASLNRFARRLQLCGTERRSSVGCEAGWTAPVQSCEGRCRHRTGLRSCSRATGRRVRRGSMARGDCDEAGNDSCDAGGPARPDHAVNDWPRNGAQAPESPPPGTQGKVTERDHLVRQVQELRRAGKFDEAVLAAERALELERRVAGGESAGVANALSRLAELHELRGRLGPSRGTVSGGPGHAQALDGKDHWRTVNGRLALTFAEKVSGLSAADRAKVQGTLRTELGATPARTAAQIRRSQGARR